MASFKFVVKRRQCWKIFTLLVIWILVLALLTIYYNKALHSNVNKVNHIISQKYFVNLSGCHMPYFNVMDDLIKTYISDTPHFKCVKAFTRTDDEGARLRLNLNTEELLKYNISDLRSIQCFYKEIKRKDDSTNYFQRAIEFKLEHYKSVDLPSNIEFIKVECYRVDANNTPPFYKDYHFFIPNKTLIASSKYQTRIGSSTIKHVSSRRKTNLRKVSVMLLGLDGLSHLNFLRHMKRTARYVHNNLSHVEFWGFNKVGDNSYPNLIPLLSGLDTIELNKSCLIKENNFDKCSFVWKQFKKFGFQTVFGEDTAEVSLFNYFAPGFRKQPTDYYLRPVMIEMERNIGYERLYSFQLCQGGRRTHDVLLEMIRKLVPYMQVQDFFSYFWTSTITHDTLNSPKLLDPDIVELFDKFYANGIFNNTIIFLMSDHGLRWGSFRKTYQGLMEERQPLLIMLYPEWFGNRYPHAIKNLRLNSNRLMTPFDIHATLMDLVDLRNLQPDKLTSRTAELTETDPMPRGISLFLPIPESRTCENAGIASHWCTCHHRRELATNDLRVQSAARYIVKLINERLRDNSQCRTLYLNSIQDASGAMPPTIIYEKNSVIDITVRIQTKPGLGEFEATVRMAKHSADLTGTISRVNQYGNQSYCINEHALKMFCYCHR